MDDSGGRRKTKIVCTLGPATADAEGIARLVRTGADVMRLNFSYGDREGHRATIRTIRRVAAEAGRHVGILQDLCGPKIRLGELAGGQRELVNGSRVRLASEARAEGDTLPVSYPYLAEDVEAGDRILMADGLVELKVVETGPNAVECEVVVGGTVASHKGVNLPVSDLRTPAFTDKDRADLVVGLEEGVDLVALSFVRHERDLDPVLEMLAAARPRPLLIAKVEKPQALERLDQILARVDGIMVARGDLGVEMPVEEVPLIQKRLIRAARRAARPVITATQMLRSMVDSPRPLRAEASDVANAVLDGTDAVMLSEETAVGRYPDEAVATLDRITRAAEPALVESAYADEPRSDLLPVTAAALSRAAARLAHDVAAAVIVASTSSGGTARLVARFRPPQPVLGLTTSAAVARQLTLSWGVVPVVVDRLENTDTMFESARRHAVELGMAGPGDRVVVTAGLPLNVPGTTNLLKVMELEGGPPQNL